MTLVDDLEEINKKGRGITEDRIGEQVPAKKKHSTDLDISFYIQVKTSYIVKHIVEVFLLKFEREEVERRERKERLPQEFSEEKAKEQSLLAKLIKLVNSNRMYMVSLSNLQIVDLLDASGTNGIIELKSVNNFSVFLTCYSKLLEVFNRWALRKKDKLAFMKTEEKNRYYIACETIITFSESLFQNDGFISNIENELPYFDLLTTLYNSSEVGSILRRHSLFIDKNIQQHGKILFNNLVMGQLSKLGRPQLEEIDPEKLENNDQRELSFVLTIIVALSLTSNRFIITETSDTIQRTLPNMITDLLLFSGYEREPENQENEVMVHLIEKKTTIFQEYDNAGIKESELNYEAMVDKLVSESEMEKKLDNQNYRAFFPFVLDLQYNLIFNYEESLLDSDHTISKVNANPDTKWSLSLKDKLNLVLNNFSLILTNSFSQKLASTSNNEEGSSEAVELLILRKILKQSLNFLTKIQLTCRNLKKTTEIKTDDVTQLYFTVKRFCEVNKVRQETANLKRMTGASQTSQPAIVIDITINNLELIAKKFHLAIDLESYRRRSIYSDQENLKVVSSLTRHSYKYNESVSVSRNQTYYKNIFSGNVEIEVDSKELYMGLSRSFIKIFNKMISRDYYLQFKRLKGELEEEFDRKYYFVERSEQELDHPGIKYLRSLHTSYFYNNIFSRSIVIYEKLLDELPDLKSYIFKDSIKNHYFVIAFTNDFNFPIKTFPYLKNLMDISIQLSDMLQRSVFHNNNWGVIMSRFFIVTSLIKNLAQDNFTKFKKVISLYEYPGSSVHHSKDHLLSGDMRSLEKTKKSFLVEICCKLQDKLDKGGFQEKEELVNLFNNKTVTTSMPVYSLWINFIEAVIYKDEEILQYVYSKLFTRYLLKMVFSHKYITDIDVVYLKKSICTFLFHLSMSPSIIDHFIKFQFELRLIYDYTIKITKTHLLRSIYGPINKPEQSIESPVKVAKPHLSQQK